MNESTARANGYEPVERLVAPAGHERPTDRFAEEMLRPLVAHEVARQLTVPAKSRWTLDDYLELLRNLAWWATLITIGFIMGGGAQ